LDSDITALPTPRCIVNAGLPATITDRASGYALTMHQPIVLRETDGQFTHWL
jgi:hypothetical protein